MIEGPAVRRNAASRHVAPANWRSRTTDEHPLAAAKNLVNTHRSPLIAFNAATRAAQISLSLANGPFGPPPARRFSGVGHASAVRFGCQAPTDGAHLHRRRARSLRTRIHQRLSLAHRFRHPPPTTCAAQGSENCYSRATPEYSPLRANGAGKRAGPLSGRSHLSEDPRLPFESPSLSPPAQRGSCEAVAFATRAARIRSRRRFRHPRSADPESPSFHYPRRCRKTGGPAQWSLSLV